MKTLLLAVTLVLISTSAHAYFLGNDIYEGLQPDATDNEYGLATGHVLTVAEILQHNGDICTSGRGAVEYLRDVVRLGYENNQAERDLHAFLLTGKYLRAAFPCYDINATETTPVSTRNIKGEHN